VLDDGPIDDWQLVEVGEIRRFHDGMTNPTMEIHRLCIDDLSSHSRGMGHHPGYSGLGPYPIQNSFPSGSSITVQACSVAFSLFDRRGTQTDKSLDLSLRLFRCEIDMHTALSRFGLRDLPEQDSSDASLMWRRQCSEVITLSQRYVAGNF
jgi:hypothetical protein